MLNNLSFYSLNGEPLQAPLEWQAAWLLLENLNPERDAVDLRLQNQPLALQRQQVNGVWRWSANWPRCGAGHYALSLNGCSQIISVLPRKITPAAFSQLLEDLSQKLTPAVALALQNGGAWTAVNVQTGRSDTLSERLNRVRRAIDGDAKITGLRQLMPLLARQPQHGLQTQMGWRKRELARRPLAAQWAQQLRAANLDAEQRPLHVLDQSYSMTFDVAENRLLKGYLQQLQQALRRLQGLARGQQVAWQAPLEALQSFVQDAQNRAFLQSVSMPPQMPNTHSEVFRRHPVYRALLKNYLYYQRGIRASLDLHCPALDAPLENLPKLYQLWCSLQVIVCVLEFAVEAGYQVIKQNFCRRGRQAWYVEVLPHGQSVLELRQAHTGRHLRLIPEPSYRRESVSFLQRPDLALEITQADGRLAIYVFDAKYKLDSEAARPQKVDIDKMHAYRDAIRPQGQAAVRYAAILYPGAWQTYDAGLQALSADPAQPERLRQSVLAVLRRAGDLTQ